MSIQALTLDQLVYAVPDLQIAVAEIGDRLGVATAYGGATPKVGPHNRLLSLGSETYLEIIAPDPVSPNTGRARPF